MGGAIRAWLSGRTGRRRARSGETTAVDYGGRDGAAELGQRRPEGGGISRRLLVGGGTAASLAGASLLWPGHGGRRLAAGTIVGGVDIGGLGRDDARLRLRERLAAFEASPVAFRFGSRTWSPTAADLGVRIDYDATISAAAAAGPAFGAVRLPVVQPFADSRSTLVALTLDETVLEAYLRRVGAEVAVPARDARLAVDAGGVRVSAPEEGVSLDLAAARSAVTAALARLEPVEIALPTEPVPPGVTAADLEEARRSAEALLRGPVAVTFDERTWELAAAQLATALALPDGPAAAPPRLAPDRLLPLLEPIAAEIDHAPVDATFGWDGGLVVVDPGEDGVAVDLPALAEAVAAAVMTERRIVDVPVVSTPPTVGPDAIDGLGITQLLASGASSFAGSSEARATNVAVATEYVSHSLIAPGGEFSFNHALGPIASERGYVQGTIILGDWFTSDIGGGVCQVSTTVFRAALFAGLPFPEWNPHTFRLAFYELDGSPPGIDAAIYQADDAEGATLDLRFANPTDGWLLLLLRLDGERLVADLYGSPTGFDVELGEPQLSDPVPAPAPIERPSDELPAGVREVVQAAQPGVTVGVVRHVRRDSVVVSETTFVSPYRPQPEIVLVGAGSSVA